MSKRRQTLRREDESSLPSASVKSALKKTAGRNRRAPPNRVRFATVPVPLAKSHEEIERFEILRRAEQRLPNRVSLILLKGGWLLKVSNKEPIF